MSDNALAIRVPAATEQPSILSVLRAAFDGDDEARIVEKLWTAGAMTRELAAVENKEIVGYCAFSEVTATPPIKGRLFGLAPVAVTPRRQNAGIGAALVKAGLALCENDGAALIVVLGEPDYYGRFGFAPASGVNVRWAAMDAGDAFQLIDYAGVADGAAYKIEYHPAFSEV